MIIGDQNKHKKENNSMLIHARLFAQRLRWILRRLQVKQSIVKQPNYFTTFLLITLKCSYEYFCDQYLFDKNIPLSVKILESRWHKYPHSFPAQTLHHQVTLGLPSVNSFVCIIPLLGDFIFKATRCSATHNKKTSQSGMVFNSERGEIKRSNL